MKYHRRQVNNHVKQTKIKAIQIIEKAELFCEINLEWP